MTTNDRIPKPDEKMVAIAGPVGTKMTVDAVTPTGEDDYKFKVTTDGGSTYVFRRSHIGNLIDFVDDPPKEARELTTEQHIADVFRVVAVRLESALDDGRPERIDAHDLLEPLLSIADELAPEFADDHQPTP